MVCCIATCAMTPAAPARSAGLVRSDPGVFTNSTNPLTWPLLPFTTPVLRPDFELFLSPCFLTSVADSSVSFTQRRSEEHTSELQSLMRISYAVFCLQKKTHYYNTKTKNKR